MSSIVHRTSEPQIADFGAAEQWRPSPAFGPVPRHRTVGHDHDWLAAPPRLLIGALADEMGKIEAGTDAYEGFDEASRTMMEHGNAKRLFPRLADGA